MDSNDKGEILYIQGDLTPCQRTGKQIFRFGQPYPSAGLSNRIHRSQKKGVTASFKGRWLNDICILQRILYQIAKYITTFSATPLYGEGKIEQAVAMAHIYRAAADHRRWTVFDHKTAPAARFSAKRQVRVMAEILRINRIMRDTLAENINRGS